MKTKKLLASVLAQTVCMVLVYLVFAFISLKVDFRCWGEDARAGYVLLVFSLSVPLHVQGVVNGDW